MMVEKLIKFLFNVGFVIGAIPVRIVNGCAVASFSVFFLRKFLHLSLSFHAGIVLYQDAVARNSKNPKSSLFAAGLILFVRSAWIVYEVMEMFLLTFRRTKLESYLNQVLSFSKKSFLNSKCQRKLRKLTFHVKLIFMVIFVFQVLLIPGSLLTFNLSAVRFMSVSTFIYAILCLICWYSVNIVILEILKIWLESFDGKKFRALGCSKFLLDLDTVQVLLEKHLKNIQQMIIWNILVCFFVYTLNAFMLIYTVFFMPAEYQSIGLKATIYYDVCSVLVSISLIVCNRLHGISIQVKY